MAAEKIGPKEAAVRALREARATLREAQSERVKASKKVVRAALDYLVADTMARRTKPKKKRK